MTSERVTHSDWGTIDEMISLVSFREIFCLDFFFIAHKSHMNYSFIHAVGFEAKM